MSFSLVSPQPRLRLYTEPYHYLMALRNLVCPYPEGHIDDAERKVREITGAKHAIFTSMGRTAIYEGIRSFITPGDEIILSPLTVPEVISVVILAGAIPVFCETKQGTWNIDPEQVESLITPKTAAIMTTHLYGNTDSTHAVKEICDRNGLVFLEDSAQALGSKWDGKSAGTWGRLGFFSFSYPKNITTFYGGMIVTDDDQSAKKIRDALAGYSQTQKKWYYKKVLSSFVKDLATMDGVYPLVTSHIIRYAYEHDIQRIKKIVEVHLPVNTFSELPKCYATKPLGLQGKICAKKLQSLEKEAKHRILAAQLYHSGLKDIKKIVLPKFYDDFTHTYLYFPIEVENRYDLMKYLIRKGQDVSYQHIPNCASLPEFSGFAKSCPSAQRAADNTLCLPTYPKYRLSEVKKTIEVIRDYFRV